MGEQKQFNRAQRQLVENFCGLPAPERRGGGRPAGQLDDLVNRLVGSYLGRSGRLQTLADLWPQIVGKTLARLCQPYGIDGAVLTVHVSGDATAQELILRQREILREIRKLPDSAGIRSLRPLNR
ncbi:MAG: DUF721 domain-containing protein [Puniceicoccales bacterium]|jgi:predicted nucleic acid-binding Zn ribbon protein|nr:DUF721 domain-containing protein [Puniceicoccales bacterium]